MSSDFGERSRHWQNDVKKPLRLGEGHKKLSIGFRSHCIEALKNVQAVQIVRTSSAIKIPKQPTNVGRGELPGWLAKIDILKIFSVFKTGVSLGQQKTDDGPSGARAKLALRDRGRMNKSKMDSRQKMWE